MRQVHPLEGSICENLCNLWENIQQKGSVYSANSVGEYTARRVQSVGGISQQIEIIIKKQDRNVVLPARKRAENLKETVDKNEIVPVIALELEDGTIITGRNTETLDSSASVLVNAIKYLANISDDIHLISPVILEPIIKLKSETLSSKNVALNCEEVLIALSICAATNPMAQAAMDKLPLLTGGQAHSTIIIPTNDEQTFRKLGIDITCDAVYPSESLYY